MKKKVKLLVGWVGWFVVALLFSSVVGLLTVQRGQDVSRFLQELACKHGTQCFAERLGI